MLAGSTWDPGTTRGFTMSAEPRYNLATKVMSNGVEVIVAGDRNPRPGEPEFLRLLSSTVTRPITLAPHTLSHHMSMLLPANLQSENEMVASLRPIEDFSKATFYTTYIYPTKVSSGSKTKTVTDKRVVTNVQEVNKNYRKELSSQEIKLSNSPILQTQVQKTVFTYLNTLLDDDQPLLMTSKRTVTNTQTTALLDTVLEPSEIFPETNTYYATREFTQTLTDGTHSKVVSTTDVVTQVVVTDPPETETLPVDKESIDVTKTYFVTYTYFSTYLENGEAKVTSHVSVSSDVTVEKFFANAKKTLMITPTPTPLNIIVTKTYTSTVTDETVTDVLEEVVTETLPPDGFPPGYLDELVSKFSSNSPIVTSAILKDGEKVEITAFQGDIIDEWYEKFKIKSTSENEITRTRPKTKTTLKYKSKSKDNKPTSKTPAIIQTNTYSTSIVASSTVISQGATLLPGDQVIVLKDEQGQTTMIPLTDPSKNKNKNKNETNVQVSDMLSLGALGINSMNVLGPVINAMADLLKNHKKDSIKKRNDTVPVKKTPNGNPLLNFMNGLKAPGESKNTKSTTSRIPVYIPVGSFADDSDTGESESQIAILPIPEKFVQEKWNDKPLKLPEKNRRTHDTNPIPLLEGGIPISPGQIITTNSDVIIGRPSDSGPRPPNFAIKNNVPIDMKPPPVEEPHIHLEPVGQFSTNQGIDPDSRPEEGVDMKPPPLPSPPKLLRPSKIPPFHIYKPHDSGDLDLNPPPPPPVFARPATVVPIPVHLNPDGVVENYVNPAHIQPDLLAVPNEMFPTPSIQKEGSKLIERSSGQPLLVNIQPSQVAQVVIPHGSSTALIISDEQQHSTKGEVIDDPSPHPEPETVGFVGAEPVLKIENGGILSQAVNVMSEVLKADILKPHGKPHPFTIPKEQGNIRPRPDYDNIGMRPPNAPIPPQYNLSKKDPSGIYVDISPPGHLPPPSQTQGNSVPISTPQAPSQENIDNHQSGVVNDVPLNAQVQLGSGRPGDIPLKEVLVSINGDNYEHKETSDHSNFIHRPQINEPEDLSPPPLPRPTRPTSTSGHSPGHVQKLPLPHGNLPKYPHVPEPADFMKPPPKPEYGNTVLIPVGSTMGQKPPTTGEMMIIQPSDYPTEDMYTDFDESLKTEDGEEIQESNSRPLLPGQLPSEVEKLMRNQSQSSNIGVSQILSFGNKNDKGVENNVPGIREPETIVGSQISSPSSSGFNSNNEAVVSVGKQPTHNHDVSMDEAEKMFGMRVPTKDLEHITTGHMRPDEINEILKPPKMEEVMGMAPPPVDRPRRPPLRIPRPKPPIKLDSPPPSNLPIAPINLENDFPPVRSPDLIKKPFKPEDVFPPRLPENFIHHEYEIRAPKPPPRPSVTSMPIDSPTESTTDSTTEINGHSKPMKTESNNTITRPKPVIFERPPHIHTQKPTNRPPSSFENKPSRTPPRPTLPEPQPTRFYPPVRNHPTTPEALKPQPTRGHPSGPDSSKKDHPFPFETPQAPNFGDKTRNPFYTGHHNRGPPMQLQPTREPFEQPPVQSPPRYDQPPPRVQPPPSAFEKPPPPRRRPASPPRDQSPTSFDQQKLSPSGNVYERPPHRKEPVEFERHPAERPVFPSPPKRIEPTPHFEGHPAQGAPPSAPPRVIPNPNLQMGESSHSLGVTRKPPPAQLKPPRGNEQPKKDNQASESAPLEHEKDNPRKNESVGEAKNDHSKPKVPQQGTRPITIKPAIEIPPPRGRPPLKPTPTIKPTKDITREPNRSTTTKEIGGRKSTKGNNIVTSMVTSGSTTIFGDLYTEPLLIQPTRVVTSGQGIQFTGFSQGPINSSPPEKIMVVSTIFPTHSTTLTVTRTMTTVVHAVGQNPVTKTVVVVTTILSTIIDKVTETETLVKPTTSTVTQTHTISTTKTALVVPTAIYPPRHKYPMPKPEIFITDVHEGRPKPEIFVADPHEKQAKPEIFVADPREKDTITISVSSSMNKKDHKDHKDAVDNESILVVVTDKPPPRSGNPMPEVLLSGVIPPPSPYPRPVSTTECLPECRASRNELCVRQEGIMKCICRPGFARMFPDQPCKPTYTYSMQLALGRMGDDSVQFQHGLHVPGSPKFVKMAGAAKEGLNRMIMQSDLRDIYHGVAINGFQPKEKKTMVDFYVQLSENVDEGKVLGVFKKSLRSSNFSLGGTEMFAAREADNLHIQDFNECLNTKFHDCSEHARCFNLKGTYTCSCKEGFTDISENQLYPGRLCSDIIGCEFCGYHGTCYVRDERQTCECFQWYTGDRCRINLKVLLIALVTIGAILLALLLVCVVMTCLKRRSTATSHSNGSTGYLRYRGPPQSLDKRAMIVDTSSESSIENMPYVNPPPPPPPQPSMAVPRKPVLRQVKRPAPRPQGVPVEQRDRSLTVMIPRVKYRAVPPLSPHLSMSTFSPDKHLNRTATQMATEQKLINYLDSGQREATGQTSQRPSKEEKRIYDLKPILSPVKKEPRVFEYEYKSSNINITDTSSGERRSKDDRFRRYSDQTPLHHEPTSLQHRKYSAGALVSAGYAVSATGGLIHDLEESTIHSNTLKSNRSQFTTLNRTGDHKTISEARSYDETMIQPQTRPLCTNYSGSSSSRLNHDENHTMVERDLGSTFLLPESHLFKPAGDRGSDISNFDSL